MLDVTIHVFKDSVYWFIACFIIFEGLSRIFPSIPNQKILRKGFLTDALYWFVLPVILYTWLSVVLTVSAVGFISGNDAEIVSQRITNGFGPLAELPVILQAILILLFSDFIQYWLHRLFHKGGWWKYHAVHHSPEEIDWLTGARFHPVNYIISFTLVGILTILMGFSPKAFILLGPFNRLYSGLVHANLNWTFGPLKYVFASPVFHRWHHTTEDRGMDKNFAPTFPFLDVMFGTFYMPKGEQPITFGLRSGEVMPESLVAQIVYPFK